MYRKEKAEKKNAEIAFKRILNKMYNEEKYSPTNIPKPLIYHSKPFSPEPKIHHNHKKDLNSTVKAGLDLTTMAYSSKPMSPV